MILFKMKFPEDLQDIKPVSPDNVNYFVSIFLVKVFPSK